MFWNCQSKMLTLNSRYLALKTAIIENFPPTLKWDIDMQKTGKLFLSQLNVMDYIILAWTSPIYKQQISNKFIFKINKTILLLQRHLLLSQLFSHKYKQVFWF